MTAASIIGGGVGSSSTGSVGGGSSNGSNSLTKKKPTTLTYNDYQQSTEMDPSSFITSVNDSGNSESSEPPTSIADSLTGSLQHQINSQQQQQQQLITQPGLTSIEMGHSRNSSNTSQVSV